MRLGDAKLMLDHKIRINIEEKAKVLADVWGTEFIKFLAVAVLHWDNLKNRKN